MEAFELAAQLGADGVELDVQRTADGVLVVCHDETVDRTSNGTGAIADLSFLDLRKLDFSGGREGFSDVRIPTLAEVLDLLDDTGMIVNVELKNSINPYPGLAQQVVDLVREQRWDDRVVISSFNHKSLAALARSGCRLPLGILYVEPLFEPWAYAATVGAKAIHPSGVSLRIDPDCIARCHDEGIAVHVWTINDPDEYAAASDADVDVVISNHPELAGR